MDAHEALQFRLVNHVVPHEELMPFTRKIALDIIGNVQEGVRELRKTYARNSSEVENWDNEAQSSRAWRQRNFDPALVAERRAKIMERGRNQ